MSQFLDFVRVVHNIEGPFMEVAANGEWVYQFLFNSITPNITTWNFMGTKCNNMANWIKFLVVTLEGLSEDKTFILEKNIKVRGATQSRQCSCLKLNSIVVIECNASSLTYTPHSIQVLRDMAKGFYKKEGVVSKVAQPFVERLEELDVMGALREEAVQSWQQFVEGSGGVESIKELLNSCSKGIKLENTCGLEEYPQVVQPDGEERWEEYGDMDVITLASILTAEANDIYITKVLEEVFASPTMTRQLARKLEKITKVGAKGGGGGGYKHVNECG